MAIIDLLHPVYIELTGYTYKQPSDYGLLRALYSYKKDLNTLAIDTDKSILFNKKLKL